MSRRTSVEVKPDQSSMATVAAKVGHRAKALGLSFTAVADARAPARTTAVATRFRNHRPALRRLLAGALLLAVLPAMAASSTDTQPPPASSAATPDAAHATTLAQRLLDHLDAGDYAAAEAMFTPRLAASVPAAMLKNIWEGLPRQLGAAQGRGATSVEAGGRGQRVEIPLRYAGGELLARIGVDGGQRIGMFLLQPLTSPSPLPPAADAPYTERDFTLATQRGELPGTLALPRGDGPFPAVVLVHGSGPHDRDETLGPNRPFLDIARGLAAHGIAVLRYDKRTRARPQDAAQPGFGIDDETTSDAVAAVTALRATPGIAPGRVFVLGHSLGGMLAPRIGLRSESAGLILLAAPSRPLLDVLLNQWQNVAANAQGPVRQQAEAAIAALQSGITRLRAGAPLPDADSPLGMPADYWRSVDAVHMVDEARQVLAGGRPLLLLQGGRDFQVMDADWQGWQQGLAGLRGASFRHYPALDHLGIAGTGPGTPADYERPGHVDATLIDDVAGWIQQQR